MRRTGYLLLCLGFLLGAYLAVERPEGVAVGPYLVALALGIAGVVLARVAIHRASRSEGVLAANLDTIGASLERLTEKIARLEREKESIGVYDLRHEIDRDFPVDLDAFVQARESLAHRFGLAAYAEVMNPFAAGERYLNRVWSASTDGYVDEANTYVAMAKDQFDEARAAFQKVKGA